MFVGGPVSPDAAIGVARAGTSDQTEGWAPLFGHLGTVDLGRDPVELPVDVQNLRVFAGYAGWTEGSSTASSTPAAGSSSTPPRTTCSPPSRPACGSRSCAAREAGWPCSPALPGTLAELMARTVVDGMNVIGSGRRLVARSRRGGAAAAAPASARGDVRRPLTLVLDGRPPADWPRASTTASRFATPAGAGAAADDRIVELVAADSDPASLRVVTSDRELADRVTALGATTEGAGAFLRRLDDLGVCRADDHARIAATAVERGDVDDLVRLVDALCASREWDRLLELRDRCEQAVARAPAVARRRPRRVPPRPRGAGTLCGDGPGRGRGRFAPAPCPRWRRRHTSGPSSRPTPRPDPRLCSPPTNVLPGEDLTGETLPGPPVLDLPLRLADWEPEYLLAHYRPDGVDLPGHVAADGRPGRGAVTRLTEATIRRRTLLDAVRAWTEGSEGRAEAIAVRGDAWPPSLRSDAIGCG